MSRQLAMPNRPHRRFISFLLLACLQMLMGPAVVHANEIFADCHVEICGGFPFEACSLRNAILSHNAKASVGGCNVGSDDDVIVLTTSPVNGPEDYYLNNSLPPISGGRLTFEPRPVQFRRRRASVLHGAYFTVEPGATILFKGVEITTGKGLDFSTEQSLVRNKGGTVEFFAPPVESFDTSYSNNGIKGPQTGGVLFNGNGKDEMGNLLIGKAVFHQGARVRFLDSKAQKGGAIYNEGAVEIQGGEALYLAENNATTAGGAIYNKGTMSIRGGGFQVLDNNSSRQGGAIYNDGGSLMLGSLISQANSALDGGLIFTRNGDVKLASLSSSRDEGMNGGRGGALTAENSTVAISNSTFDGGMEGSNREVPNQGGAIYLDGTSTLGFSGGSCSNYKSVMGGCLYSDGGTATLEQMVCERNAAQDGGCLFVGGKRGKLFVIQSKIKDNKVTKHSRGGGLLAQNAQVMISGSEITGNSAGGFGDGGTGSGGGIFGVTNNADSPTEITMVGSTVAANTASRLGAAIEMENFSSFVAVNSTFVHAEPVDVPEHGIHFVNSYTNIISSTFSSAPLSVDGSVEGDLRNSIFLNSSICLGNVDDQGHNLQLPAPFKGCRTSIPVIDPKLDPAGLKNNGGPARTIALQRNSPAIDYISRTDCTDPNGDLLLVDQRGRPRPDPNDGPNGPCDVGAYESQGEN